MDFSICKLNLQIENRLELVINKQVRGDLRAS